MRKRGLFFLEGVAGGRGGVDCGLSWKFYTQIPMAEHVEGFYTDASGQGQQLGVPQRTAAAAGVGGRMLFPESSGSSLSA